MQVYCFDPREYNKSSSGVSTTGPYRAQFVIDAVADLRENMRAAGSDLIVRCGKPEEVHKHSQSSPYTAVTILKDTVAD